MKYEKIKNINKESFIKKAFSSSSYDLPKLLLGIENLDDILFIQNTYLKYMHYNDFFTAKVSIEGLAKIVKNNKDLDVQNILKELKELKNKSFSLEQIINDTIHEISHFTFLLEYVILGKIDETILKKIMKKFNILYSFSLDSFYLDEDKFNIQDEKNYLLYDKIGGDFNYYLEIKLYHKNSFLFVLELLNFTETEKVSFALKSDDNNYFYFKDGKIIDLLISVNDDENFYTIDKYYDNQFESYAYYYLIAKNNKKLLNIPLNGYPNLELSNKTDDKYIIYENQNSKPYLLADIEQYKDKKYLYNGVETALFIYWCYKNELLVESVLKVINLYEEEILPLSSKKLIEMMKGTIGTKVTTDYFTEEGKEFAIGYLTVTNWAYNLFYDLRRVYPTDTNFPKKLEIEEELNTILKLLDIRYKQFNSDESFNSNQSREALLKLLEIPMTKQEE